MQEKRINNILRRRTITDPVSRVCATTAPLKTPEAFLQHSGLTLKPVMVCTNAVLISTQAALSFPQWRFSSTQKTDLVSTQSLVS